MNVADVMFGVIGSHAASTQALWDSSLKEASHQVRRSTALRPPRCPTCPYGQTVGSRQVNEENSVAMPAPADTARRRTETLTQRAEPRGPFTHAGAGAPGDTTLSRARHALSGLLTLETASVMKHGGVFTANFRGGSRHSTDHWNSLCMKRALPFSILFFRLFCPQQTDFTIHRKVAICLGCLSVAM